MDPNILDPNAPNMGISYGALAQLQPDQSVVPGGNPAGNIGTAAQAGFLGQDAARRDAFIRQAAQIAELDAQVKATQAGEYQAGAPGRMANIGVANALAQGQQADLPTLLSTAENKRQAAASQSKQQAAQAEIDKTQPYANLWVNSQGDKQSTDKIREMMKKDGVTKVGVHDIDDMSDDDLTNWFNHVRNSTIFSPAQVGKERIANISAASRVLSSYNMGMGRAEAARITAEANIYIKQHPNPNKNPDQQMFEYVVRTRGPEAAGMWYQDEMIERRRAGAQNPAQQLDINPDAGTVSARNPVPPKAVPLPPIPPGFTPPADATALAAPNSSKTSSIPPSNAFVQGMPLSTGGPPQVTTPMPGNTPGPAPQLPTQPPAAITPPAAGKVKMPESQALKMVKAAKGTPNYAKMKAYFVAAYGHEPD